MIADFAVKMTGAFLGAFLGMFLGMWLFRRPHRHTFTFVALEYGRVPTPEALGGGVFNMTTVLERCACGETRTASYRGHWTRQQLTGEPPPAADAVIDHLIKEVGSGDVTGT